jgi:hypothetical protein
MTSYAVKAAEAGLDPTRLKRAFGLLASWADSGRVAGSAILSVANGVSLPARGLGRPARGHQLVSSSWWHPLPNRYPPWPPSSSWSGGGALSDRMCDIVPEFEQRGSRALLFRTRSTQCKGV